MPPLVEISSTRSATAKRQSRDMSESAVRPDPKPVETVRHDDDIADDDSDSDALVIDIGDDPHGSPKKAAPAAPPPENPKSSINTRSA